MSRKKNVSAEKERKYKTSKNLVAYISPTSTVSESYRALRTNIQYSSIDKKLKTILITSPDEQDGKSVTACNLAISIANTSNKVLLIDADLRRPSIHKQFYTSSNIGLTNVLLEEETLEEALFTLDDMPNLHVLPSGTIPPNPSEILVSKKMKELLNHVSNIYDTVIIDSPPICYVPDGIILSRIVDGVILTISAKKTNIGFAQSATKALKQIDANILGVVFTQLKTKEKYYD